MAHVSTESTLSEDAPCCPAHIHDGMKASEEGWRGALLAGYQTGFPATDLYEVRLCPRCRTTMMLPVLEVAVAYLRGAGRGASAQLGQPASARVGAL